MNKLFTLAALFAATQAIKTTENKGQLAAEDVAEVKVELEHDFNQVAIDDVEAPTKLEIKQEKKKEAREAIVEAKNAKYDDYYGGDYGEEYNPEGIEMDRYEQEQQICAASQEEILGFFNQYDADQSGSLDVDEAIQSLWEGAHTYDNLAHLMLIEIEEMWTKIDKDHDQTISRDEFLEGSKCLYGKPKISWMLDYVMNNDDDTDKMLDADAAAEFMVHEVAMIHAQEAAFEIFMKANEYVDIAREFMSPYVEGENRINFNGLWSAANTMYDTYDSEDEQHEESEEVTVAPVEEKGQAEIFTDLSHMMDTIPLSEDATYIQTQEMLEEEMYGSPAYTHEDLMAGLSSEEGVDTITAAYDPETMTEEEYIYPEFLDEEEIIYSPTVMPVDWQEAEVIYSPEIAAPLVWNGIEEMPEAMQAEEEAEVTYSTGMVVPE